MGSGVGRAWMNTGGGSSRGRDIYLDLEVRKVPARPILGPGIPGVVVTSGAKAQDGNNGPQYRKECNGGRKRVEICRLQS